MSNPRRLSSTLFLALLPVLTSACSDSENAPGSAGAGGASEQAGASSGGNASAGDTAEAGASGDDARPGAGAGGAAGEAGIGGEASAGMPSAGSGSGGSAPVGDICEQVVALLTGCGQLQGAGEASENCEPSNPLSQCAVACMLEKKCEDVGNWPEPIEGCVAECIAMQ